MENVASFVPLGSGVLPVLTSRRVNDYSWDELATAPAYDRIELSPATADVPDNTGINGIERSPSAGPSHTSAVPTVAIDPQIEGVWETQRLTRETMAATLEAAGLDPGLAAEASQRVSVGEALTRSSSPERSRRPMTLPTARSLTSTTCQATS
jgi:hypothetical protein